MRGIIANVNLVNAIFVPANYHAANACDMIMLMERPKPIEFIRNTAGMVANAGRVALHQMGGGAWGQIGERYGEQAGGHSPHPASITFYGTPEQPALEIPDNIHVGTE